MRGFMYENERSFHLKAVVIISALTLDSRESNVTLLSTYRRRKRTRTELCLSKDWSGFFTAFLSNFKMLLHSLSNLNYFIFQHCGKHQQTSVTSLFHQIWTQCCCSSTKCIFLWPSYLCLSSLEQS